MSSIQRYLQMANRSVNEQFVGVDGFVDDDMYFTGWDSFQNADGGEAAPALNASTGAMRSQPYIITVSNASNAAVSVDVFGAYIYLNNAGFTAGGTLVIGSITISSGISDISYREMLYQFMNQPYSVGLTYIQSATANQVLETISVNTKDANGNLAQKTLVPTIDPYQQQTNIIAMKYAYRIDGFTKLTVQMFAATSVQFQFYPADTINIARGLSGAPVSKQFGNPKIIRPAARG